MNTSIKEKLAQGLLELNKNQSLESISVKNLLEYTNISKQSFYNHFLDKNDLIQYIYLHYIIPEYNETKEVESFKESLSNSLENMSKYSKFLKEALLMTGQNNLTEYIYDHCASYDLKWHKELYGDELPEALRLATIYHAKASTSMIISWILSGTNEDIDVLCDMICHMRGLGMDDLFKDSKNKGNPYK